MKTKILLLLAMGVGASHSQAQYIAHYDVTLEDDYEITNILIGEDYGDGSSSLTLPFSVGGIGTTRITNPFPSDPPPAASMMIGLAQDLPGDAPGQKHVVLMMSENAANLSRGIAWGTLFRNTLEEQLIAAIELGTSGQGDEIVGPAIGEIFDFIHNDFANGILGPGGFTETGWFDQQGPFSVMAFSDGQQLGTGLGSIEAVPEPASLAALGLAIAAMKRRRK